MRECLTGEKEERKRENKEERENGFKVRMSFLSLTYFGPIYKFKLITIWHDVSSKISARVGAI